MRLSRIVKENQERLAREWCHFARENIPAARTMDEVEIRDHLIQILDRISEDIESRQTPREQEDKGKGHKELNAAQMEASIKHGQLRALASFSLKDAGAEFRALRASVIRLWEENLGESAGHDELQELIRFSEAIDEVWMQSIIQFQLKVDESRDILLGVLGHDLRTPLAAIMGAAELLVAAEGLASQDREVAQLSLNSARRMQELIDNLLELTRIRLGGGLVLKRKHCNLVHLCKGIIAEIRMAYPSSQVRIEAQEEVEGEWDVMRIHEAVGNLIVNGIRYGTEGTPVRVAVWADAGQGVISVSNEGEPIPESMRKVMFQGMFRNTSRVQTSGSFGLGLYIVKEIVDAHGGSIQLSPPDAAGTTFTVCLPTS